MPSNAPVFTKKLILIITLVIIIAGILAVSPMLLGGFGQVLVPGGETLKTTEVSPVGDLEPGLTNPTEVSSVAVAEPTSANPAIQQTYKYILPMVRRPYDYVRQGKTPVYLANFAHSEVGCSWLGVAGQVFGKNNEPINGMIIGITGKINDNTISLEGVTGDAAAYGPGGYEIKIADAPFESTRSLLVVLYDTNHKKVAQAFHLATYKDCNKNLMIVNFVPIK